MTTAINLGFIPYKPVVKLDTPSGVVECIVERNDNIVVKVTFTNVPSFTLYQDVNLEISEHGTIINSMFTGRILEEKVINQYRGIIPQITGSAWITGTHQFFIQDKDPYPQGFEII